MASQYRHRRTSSPSTPFPGLLEPGEIAVNTANRQLALGDADGATIGAPLQLLTIRYFDARAQYAANDYVLHGGTVYRAKGPIPPGAFNASNWDVAANPGTFVMRAGDTMTGHLSLPPTPAAAECGAQGLRRRCRHGGDDVGECQSRQGRRYHDRLS